MRRRRVGEPSRECRRATDSGLYRIPNLVEGRATRASSETTTASQAHARSTAAPKQAPSTAATTGSGLWVIR